MTEIVEKHKPYLKILVNFYFSFIFFCFLNNCFQHKDFKNSTQKTEIKMESLGELFSKAINLLVNYLM